MNGIAGRYDFNPSGVGLKNGNFIGLPFTEDTASIILLPVPWDVTVSFGEGTALGTEAIREASAQLDLYDPDVKDAWKLGIFMLPEDKTLLEKRNALRPKAKTYIDFLEAGGDSSQNPQMQNSLLALNAGCDEMIEYVYSRCVKILDEGKLAAIIGGDHSVPYGLIKALSEKHPGFGILQIDAHQDLRDSYEGFKWSHASIFHNVMKKMDVSVLVQAGIRDYCEEELEVVEEEGERIKVFFDHQMKEDSFMGKSWNEQCEKIIGELPQVYI